MESTPPSSAFVFGIPVHFLHHEEVFEFIERAVSSGIPRVITYSHFAILLLARTDATCSDVLSRADINRTDGVGVQWAIRFLHGLRFPRVSEAKMYDGIIEMVIRRGWRLMVIGGTPATGAAFGNAFINQSGPIESLRCFDGYRPVDDEEIGKSLRDFQPHVLMLGIGGAKQFAWLAEHRTTGVPITITVGGFLDFYAGTKPRAPLWMQRAGIEWVHRLLLEPGRMAKRYLLGVPRFILLVSFEKIRMLLR